MSLFCCFLLLKWLINFSLAMLLIPELQGWQMFSGAFLSAVKEHSDNSIWSLIFLVVKPYVCQNIQVSEI